MNVAFAVGAGLALGLRHATDADHIVALATLLRSRSGIRGALTLGAIWGLGHSVVVVAAGVAVIGLGLRMPEPFERYAELGVAAMLIALGLAHVRPRLPEHAHDDRHVNDPGRHGHGHESPRRFGLRPLLIGMVHGLAGSAGLALLALMAIPVPALAFLYLMLFGTGTVIGMLALTSVLSLPFQYAGRSPHLERRIVQLACATSIAMGIFLGLRVMLGGEGV
jgi:nickel/cobalt transporter (NicO) family protein